MKAKVLTLIVLFLFPFFATAQVTINDTGDDAHASAILDVNASDKGLLLPRVVITDVDSDMSPVENPANGLIVHNTGSAQVPEGLYMWSNTDDEWVEIITSKNSTIQTMQTGAGGYIMQWGGELDTDDMAIFGASADNGGSNGTSYKTIGMVPRDGYAKTFSWSSEAGDNTSVIEIIVNDVSTSFTLTGISGVLDFASPIEVFAGDEIEFDYVSGTQPLHIGLMLYID